MPGNGNNFSDATSRNPVTDDDVACSEILAGIMIDEPEEECVDNVAFLPSTDSKDIRAVTWDIVKQETSNDGLMRDLSTLINTSFPNEKHELPLELHPYWSIRQNLYIVDGVVLMKNHVVIPRSLRNDVAEAMTDGSGSRILISPNLRQEIIRSLHSAHQGVCSMKERAIAGVYWPGITKDIEAVRLACSSCNRSMPSQPRTIPVEPIIPSTPFEAVASDYFHFNGFYYFIGAVWLSGWFEVQQIRVGTNEAGSKGLLQALRRLMIQVGVPREVSSDGGPEFIAKETEDFFSRWGIHHRLSSAYHPASNGRAELAVKTAKRLLMDNVGANGSLDNDAIVRAFLTYRNTPDPGCKLSPAQILLGRQLRDTLPCISKDVMLFNNVEVNPQWREAWKAKEEALKVRYVKSMENLAEHARPQRPLEHGDRVIIQNQNGRFAKKWDKSGVAVEVKPNDQYTVKVDGSGRLTLRNRRFLRKYVSHQLRDQPKETNALPEMQPWTMPTGDAPQETPPTNLPVKQLRPSTAHIEPPIRAAPSAEADGSVLGRGANHVRPIGAVSSPEADGSDMGRAANYVRPIGAVPSPEADGSVLGRGANHVPLIRASSSPEADGSATPEKEQLNFTRPKRVRSQRQLYDASTGRYVTPQTVGDNV